MICGMTWKKTHPFIAIKMIHHHHQKWKSEFPRLFDVLSSFLYIDDFIGVESLVEAANALQKEISLLMDVGRIRQMVFKFS